MGAIINENIITIVFDDEHSVETPSLYQYDKGIVLKFLDVPDLVDIEFTNMFAKETITKIISNGQVAIPDSILAEPSSIKAYLRYITADSEMTEKVITIPVESREKPSDYIAPEDEPTFRTEMQSIMEETKAIAEEAKDAVENFELSDEQMQEIIENVDTYDKDTIDEKLAQKKSRYSGTNAPTSNPNDYPGIGYGDTYYQRGEGRLYCVEGLDVHPASGTILNVYWKALPSSSDVDLKIEEYNESKKVNAEVKNYMDIHLEATIESELYPVGDDGKITIESARILSSSSVSIYSYDSEGKRINTTFVDKNALKNLPMEIELNCEYFALFFAFSMGVTADIQVSTVSYQKMELAEKVEILEENMNLYDKSEVVDKKIQTAIEEAFNGIATAEGSEF